jgi:hypothetical protein
MAAPLGIALADLQRMVRMKRFLIAVSVAGCGGGGGESGMDIDASMMPGDGAVDGRPDGANPDAGQGNDANQTPIDSGPVVAAANDRCANATQINIDVAMHATLATTTAGAHADLDAPCGTAGQPDVFFTFTLTRRELVYADTFGASANTALYFATSCSTARTGSTTTGDAVCSTGACGTGQSQVTALLDPGTHYLVLSGNGAATIHFQHVEVGDGTVGPLAQGSSAPTGTTTSGGGTLYECQGGGPENSYWWRSCPADAGGAFLASTCTGTTFDTILSLQMPGADTVMCDDDTCSVQSTVSANIPGGAGLFVLSVDGFSAAKFGNYTLTATRP